MALQITVGITSSSPNIQFRLCPDTGSRKFEDKFEDMYKIAFSRAQELVANTRYELVKLYLSPEDPPALVAGVVLGFASRGIPVKLHSTEEQGHLAYPGVEMWTMPRLARVECG